MRSILITQCLQRDYVDLVAAHEPLPNQLHVGREEALRLLGTDPAVGPVAQLVAWARAQHPEDLLVVHIRDLHDPADPRQRDHLRQFGPHGIRGSAGARLVLGMDEHLGPNEKLVDAIALNDFEDTTLRETLAGHLDGRDEVRVGVVGVWTEAKVTFLLYDLKTRLGLDQLATSSALTASASRTQHFNALDQLRKILGVAVFDSIGEFTEWLVPHGARPALPTSRTSFGPALAIGGGGASGAAALTEADREILGFLYRDSARVELQPLSGGFSGASVFRVTSHDAMGHEQAPSVAKLGPRGLIAKERSSFERVESILGNNAPSVRGFVDLGERAGLKYAFASMGGKVRTFKSLYESGAAQEQIDAVLRTVFDEVLGRLYGAAQYERLPLLEHYGFDPRFAAGVRERVAAIAGAGAAGAERLGIGGRSFPNVAGFYEGFLAETASEVGEYHFVSFVHGDLNGANILLDGRDNVWVIDFFHTARGHVLKDLAKLENDLLYIWTAVADDDASLAEALAISDALRAVEDLAAPLPERIDGVTRLPLVRAWSTVRTLRAIGARLVQSDRDPQQLRIALLRYAVHTLSFDESSAVQKRWALAAACGLAEDVAATVRRNALLRVDWLEGRDFPTPVAGRLGMTLLPGRKDRGRSLADDLAVLGAQGVTRLVTLATPDELAWAGVAELGREAECLGITVESAPIPDQRAPSLADAERLVSSILGSLAEGRAVVVHCVGGLGRTGTIAACALVARGASPAEALAAVRRVRGPRAVETEEQERLVGEFAERVVSAARG